MLKSLSEFKNNLKYSVVERVSNPLIAAFLFSWLCLNWKIILILFLSKKDIEFRIKDMIDAGGVLVSLVFPVISAIFYVVVMPHLVEYAYKFQSGPFKRSQDKLADRIDNALKRKKITEMLRAEADIAYDRKTTDAEKEIEEMRLGINELKDQNGKKEKTVSEITEKLDKLKIKNKDLEADLGLLALKFDDNFNDFLRLQELSKSALGLLYEQINAEKLAIAAPQAALISEIERFVYSVSPKKLKIRVQS